MRCSARWRRTSARVCRISPRSATRSARSLASGAAAVRDYLAAIAGPAELTTPARIIGRLHADLRYDDEAQMRRGDFVGLLDRVVGELAKTHDAIATQYFVT